MRIKRTNRHHRKSRARGGTNDPTNLVRVDERQHNSFHNLFQDTHPEKIAEQLNEKWIDPDYHIFVVETRVVKALKKLLKQLT